MKDIYLFDRDEAREMLRGYLISHDPIWEDEPVWAQAMYEWFRRYRSLPDLAIASAQNGTALQNLVYLIVTAFDELQLLLWGSMQLADDPAILDLVRRGSAGQSIPVQ